MNANEDVELLGLLLRLAAAAEIIKDRTTITNEEQTNDLCAAIDSVGVAALRLAAAAERIAEAMEEANRWFIYLGSDREGIRVCRSCGKGWHETLAGWRQFYANHPGCPRCRGKEASDAEA